MLEKVRFGDYHNGIDVEAFTDGYAYDEYSCLYLLSVAGRDSSVKAVTSAVVSGRSVEVVSKKPIELHTPYSAKYRILSSKLPGSALHQVVAEEGFFRSAERPERLLYVQDCDVPGLVYEAVKTAYPVPLMPGWSGWLYKRLRRDGCVRELEGTKKVLRLSLDEETLDLLVSQAIRSGEISF